MKVEITQSKIDPNVWRAELYSFPATTVFYGRDVNNHTSINDIVNDVMWERELPHLEHHTNPSEQELDIIRAAHRTYLLRKQSRNRSLFVRYFPEDK